MNRETESKFALVPTIEKPRSIFDRSNQIKTSFNAGQLIPIEVWNDVMPGDTIQMNTANITRMTSALKTPVMDNAYLDIFYFFVPYRLVMKDWQKFMGENDDPWITNQTAISNLRLTAPSGGFATGTLADYMGIPTKVANLNVDRMPFNAYCKIYNDHFRDENSEYALDMDVSTTTKTGSNGTTAVTDCCLGGMPAKVNKFHDYFTSCLPSPLRHTPVTLPLGSSAPVSVYGNGYALGLTANSADSPTSTSCGTMIKKNTGLTSGGSIVFAYTDGHGTNTTSPYKVGDSNTTINYSSTDSTFGVTQNPALSGLAGTADLSNATAANISLLYQAFALQELYQADARGGTRYNEIIYSHFGVKSPDARLQRSEYLGGKRIALNNEQVEANTTATNQYIGSLGAYSLTADQDDSFVYSAQEFGILMCLACVRTEHSYQQGLNRMWSRVYKEDYYFPELANLAEQAVLNKELYAQGTSADDQVFGYQEAWADYRYKPSRVSGQMRSNATGTLDTWHYADNYGSLPTLSPGWLEEPTTNLDRTLAVTSSTANQIISDFYFETKWTREMPMYSIPGLQSIKA